MPFTIIRNDITNMRVDAIVNTANPKPVIGYGVDAGVHQKAGPKLLEARVRIGRIPVGGAAITAGFELPARYVIHAVGPVWRGGLFGEERLLRKSYENALNLALEMECESVAFPLISAGNHGFPKPKALQIAMSTISAFLMEHEMQVYLVVFSEGAFRLSEKLFDGVSSYIDEHYVRQTNQTQYGVPDKCTVRGAQQELILRQQMRQRQMQAELEDTGIFDVPDAAPAPMSRAFAAGTASAPKALSLSELLAQTDEGFSENLLRRIDKSGKKDSEIYKRANVSRQHFSKIRNNPAYKPTKATALAFAVALELDLNETKDLLSRAGYTLSRSSKSDIIIEYFIQSGNYNIHEINMTLFEFDQSLLGA